VKALYLNLNLIKKRISRTEHVKLCLKKGGLAL
jgi:hypothetical protein